MADDPHSVSNTSALPNAVKYAIAATALLLAGLLFPAIASAAPPIVPVERAIASAPPAGETLLRAVFADKVPSAQVREVADWTVATGDNQNLPFIIVDKVAAKLFLFDRQGVIKAETAVLLGLARGDVSPPGIGDRPLATMTAAERITPAGRFVAGKGVNLAGQDILWVDYDAAIAIHRATDVKPGLSARDRLVRLNSLSPLDNRISHGCINVSQAFYDAFIRPTFAATAGIVYVLPETMTISDVFNLQASKHAEPTRSLP